jgi:DNA-binding MarR family transcriptional regulator
MNQHPASTCPTGRLSSPTREARGRAVVDIDTYIPYFLVSVNNAHSRTASKLYLERFGIGVADWRVISMLACEPGITARRICDVVALDKAATSRSLSTLAGKGLVTGDAPQRDPRRRTWRLTATGDTLHDAILQVALSRERALIAGVDPADLEAFLRVMRIMRRNTVENDDPLEDQ